MRELEALVKDTPLKSTLLPRQLPIAPLDLKGPWQPRARGVPLPAPGSPNVAAFDSRWRESYNGLGVLPMTLKKFLQLSCVIASFAALIWLLSRLGWQTIASAVERIGWLSGSVLFLSAIAESTLDGCALRVIMGPSMRVMRTLTVNAAGTLMNMVLPWESGEVLKSTLLKGSVGTPRAVSSTIIWNYIFKISRPSFSLLMALLALVFCTNVEKKILVLVVVANVIAFAPYLVLRVVIGVGAAEKLMRLLHQVPRLRIRTAHWLELAQRIDQEVQGFWRERPTAYLRAFLLQFLARATGWLNIYLGFRAIGSPLTLSLATLMYAAMNVAEYLITLLPARIGVSEGTAFFMCRLFGFNAPMGLVLYAFLRMRNIIVCGLMAPFAFFSVKPAADPV